MNSLFSPPLTFLNFPLLIYLLFGIIILLCETTRQREIAQLGRAPGLGPGGRRFESCFPD